MRCLLLVGLLFLASCAEKSEEERQAEALDTMTTRQIDSAIGESRLPGAGGVRGAVRAADSAAARRAREDSIARQP
jgi:hypothetical protein